MAVTLFPYQATGAAFLAARRHAYLADEMGLGKTAQALEACRLVGAEHVLVVCPAGARGVWARAVREWGPRLPWKVVTGTQLELDEVSSYVMSYETAVARHAQLTDYEWSALIVDEAHYLKSARSQRTKAVLGKLGLVHCAERTWLLSGTPAPNHAQELWPWLFATGATALDLDRWTIRYCYGPPGHAPGLIEPKGTRQDRVPELREILYGGPEPRFLRRRKVDVLQDLPPLSIRELPVDVHPDWLRREAVADGLPPEEVEAAEAALATAEASARAAGASWEPLPEETMALGTVRRLLGQAKVPAVAELAREFLTGCPEESLVLFAWHRGVLDRLAEALRDFSPVMVRGGVTDAARRRAVDAFQAGTARVFLGQVTAAGTALTLTRASRAWLVEYSWVPGENAQAIARCHRIGARAAVEGVYLTAAGTIDEVVTDRLARKTRELLALVG